MHHSLFVIVLLFAVVQSQTIVLDAVEVQINGTFYYNETFGSFRYAMSSDLGVVGELVVLEGDGCEEEQYVDVLGKVVVVSEFGCWHSVKAGIAQQYGAVAIAVLVTGTEGRVGSFFNYFVPNPEDVHFPVFPAGKSDVERWVNMSDEGFVVILNVQEIENPYAVLYGSSEFILFQIMVIAMYLIFTGYVCFKLYISVKNTSFTSILSYSLIIELFSCLIRILFWIDPIGAHGWYSLYVSRCLFTLVYGPSILGQFLITLYWMESLNAVDMSVFLSPASIVIAIIVGFLLISLSVASSFSIAFVGSGSIVGTILDLLLSLVILIITIFYFFIVVKLIMFVNTKVKRSKKRQRKSKIAIFWYLLSGLLCLLFLTVASISPIIGTTPVGVVVWYFLMTFILWMLSFTKVFPTPSKRKMSSSSTLRSKNVKRSETIEAK